MSNPSADLEALLDTQNFYNSLCEAVKTFNLSQQQKDAVVRFHLAYEVHNSHISKRDCKSICVAISSSALHRELHGTRSKQRIKALYGLPTQNAVAIPMPHLTEAEITAVQSVILPCKSIVSENKMQGTPKVPLTDVDDRFATAMAKVEDAIPDLHRSRTLSQYLARVKCYLSSKRQWKTISLAEAEKTAVALDGHERILFQLAQLDIVAQDLRQVTTSHWHRLFLEKERKLEDAERRILELASSLREHGSETPNDQSEELSSKLQLKEQVIENLRNRIAELSAREQLLDSQLSVTIADQRASAIENAQTEAPQIVLDGPQAIIDDIRRGLGVGLQLTPEIQSSMSNLYRTLESALNKLAEDIYSTGSQFAMELFQNADDNTYTTGTEPTLKIKITPTYIWTENNEVGFSEANVRALCNVGGSTKSQSLGTTGHKGIGFKSVFKVTNKPHVFSKGFSFKFDVAHKLGYIVPQWLDASSDSLASLLPEKINPDLTHFYLPLKETAHKEFDAKELFSNIDLSPLFLRRLSCVDIELLETNGSVSRKNIRSHSSAEAGTMTLDISHSTWSPSGDLISQSHRSLTFYVFRRNLEIPDELLDARTDAKRAETHTEVVLAFPANPTDLRSENGESQCAVYTFLPVKQVGLPFVVQADFLLVTSRQDIHRNKYWNRWLRDKIPTIFIEAVHQFEDSLKQNIASYIPAAGDVSDPFWTPIVPTIRVLISSEKCVCSASGRWCRPSELLFPSNEISDLITNEDILRHIGLEYTAPSLTEDVAVRLGVPKMQLKHLIDCFACQENPFAFASKPISWFTSVYELFSAKSHELLMVGKDQARLIDMLFDFPILLLDSEEKISPAMGKALFWPDESRNFSYELGSDCLRLIHHQCTRASTLVALRNFGAQPASPKEIVAAIIDFHLSLPLPVIDVPLPASQVTSSLKKQITEQLRFLCEVGMSSGAAHSASVELQTALLLPATFQKTSFLARPSTIYFPDVFDRHFAPIHADARRLDLEISDKLAPILRLLCVQDRPRLITIPSQYEYRLSTEFTQWLKAAQASKDPDSVLQVLKTLQHHWIFYRQCSTLSTYLRDLRNAKTAPLTVKAFTQEQHDGMLTHARLDFNHAFVDTPEFRELIGDYLPTFSDEITSPELLNELGIFQSISSGALHAMLTVLDKFRVTDKSMWERVYQKIMENNYPTPKQIFVPEVSSSFLSSRFIQRKTMVSQSITVAKGSIGIAKWSDKLVLEGIYSPKVCQYFAASPEITMDHCRIALINIVQPGEPGTAKAKKQTDAPAFRSRSEMAQCLPDLEDIYKRVESILKKTALANPTGVSQVNVLVLDESLRLRSLQKDMTKKGLMIPDNKRFYDMFKDTPVAFVHEIIVEHCPTLCQALKRSGLPTLTSLLNCVPQWNPEKDVAISSEWSLKYRAAISFAVKLAATLTKEERDLFYTLMEKILVCTVNTKQADATSFNVTYQLPVVRPEGTTMWRMMKTEKFFYDAPRMLLYLPKRIQLAEGRAVDNAVLSALFGFEVDDMVHRFLKPATIDSVVMDLPAEMRNLSLPEGISYKLLPSIYTAPKPSFASAAAPKSNAKSGAPTPASAASAVSGTNKQTPSSTVTPAKDAPRVHAEAQAPSSSITHVHPEAQGNQNHSTSANSSSLSPFPLPSDRINGHRSTTAPVEMDTIESRARFEQAASRLENLLQSDSEVQRQYLNDQLASQNPVASGSDAEAAPTDVDLSHPDHLERTLALQNAYLESIGSICEMFIFLHLQRQPSISNLKWWSRFRDESLLNLPVTLPYAMNDGLGYDMEYFSANSGKTYLVEVKGSVAETDTFHLSRNEWQCAESNHSMDNIVYVIFCVALLPQPRIVHRIEDPVDMKQKGLLLLEADAYSAKIQSTKNNKQRQLPELADAPTTKTAPQKKEKQQASQRPAQQKSQNPAPKQQNPSKPKAAKPKKPSAAKANPKKFVPTNSANSPT